MSEDIKFAITILASALGGGGSAYLGVRLALARLEGRMASIEKDVSEHGVRLDRLERPFFERSTTP